MFDCFGSPTIIADSPKCRSCSRARQCAKASVDLLGEMEEEAGSLSREKQRVISLQLLFTPTALKDRLAPTSRRVGKRIAKTLSDTYEKAAKGGWFDLARSDLLNGTNPGRKPWERVFFSQLMAGADRGDLILAFTQQLGMTQGSANTKVSRALTMYREAGVLDRNNQLVRKKQSCQ